MERHVVLFSRKGIPLFISCVLIFACSNGRAQVAGVPFCEAQSGQTAIVSGTVSDPSGSNVTVARITLRCGNTVKTVRTNASGSYSVTIPAGKYLLQVQAPGFALWEQQVSLDTAHQENVILQIAKANSSVTVTAASGFVADDSATGSKTNTSLLQIPQSLTVETRDQLTTQNAENVGSALRYVAGVNGEVYGGSDQRVDWYVIRGFTDTFPLLDGLPTATYYTLLSPKLEVEDAERVEVLRGPSSSMYGQTTPGGVVNLVTKRPRAIPLRSLTFETGSFGRVQGDVDFSGTLDQRGHFLYRVTGFGRGGGTQVDHVDDNRYFLAPASTWQPSDKTSLTLLTHQSKDDGGWTFQYLPQIGTLTKADFGLIPRNMFTGDLNYNQYKRTEHAESAFVDHLFSNAVRGQLSARFVHSNVNFKNLMGAGLEDDGHTLDRYVFGGGAQMNQFVTDGHVGWTAKRGHLQQTLLAGFNYLQSNDTWVEIDGLDPVTLDLLHPNYRQTFDLPAPDFISADGIKQTGVYLQDQVQWRGLTLTLNGREDWAKTLSRVDPDPTPTSQSPSKFTYRTGLSYAVTESIVPYFSYTTSFQPSSGTTFDGQAFKPLTAQQYETGIRYKPTAVNALFSVAAYSLTEQNVTTLDPDHPNFNVQRGEVQSRGLEFEAKTTLPGGLNGTASYTYTSPEITKSNDLDLHKAPLNIPRNMANLWLDKTLHKGVWNNLGFGGGVRFLGKRWGDTYNTLQVPNNTLVDLMAHYSFSSWKVSANATNLGDRQYVATCENTSRCVYGQSRSVFANVSYQW